MSEVQWLVAKYVPDLRRDEPRNCGVILRVGQTFVHRFIGERDDGRIDGRRLRSLGIRSSDTYRAWVHHWLSAASELGPELSDISPLEDLNPTSNFRLIYGGDLLATAEVPDPSQLLEELYAELVAEEVERDTDEVSFETAAENLIQAVGIEPERDYSVWVTSEGRQDKLRFHYAYMNGAASYMRRISLADDSATTWDYVHATQWTFKEVLEAQRMLRPRAVALVRISEANEELESQLQVLETYSATVNVDVPQAAEQLGELLGL